MSPNGRRVRFVRRDRQVRPDANCQLCGTRWGSSPKRRCPAVTCLACGTTQCMVNGLSNGTCAICFYGILPGWGGSDQTCGHKGCQQKAVAQVGGHVQYKCRHHLRASNFWKGIQSALAIRSDKWMEISEEG
jgi:hypothetical protein